MLLVPLGPLILVRLGAFCTNMPLVMLLVPLGPLVLVPLGPLILVQLEPLILVCWDLFALKGH